MQGEEPRQGLADSLSERARAETLGNGGGVHCFDFGDDFNVKTYQTVLFKYDDFFMSIISQ